jgi:hypothetical protein
MDLPPDWEPHQEMKPVRGVSPWATLVGRLAVGRLPHRAGLVLAGRSGA